MDLETAEIVLRGRANLCRDAVSKNILLELTDEARNHRLGREPDLSEVELEEELIALLQGPNLPDSSVVKAVASIMEAKEDEETERVLSVE